MPGLQKLALILLIGVGGGIGSILRYLVGGWTQTLAAGPLDRFAAGAFPLGTLVVNVVGCFVIAVLNVLLLSSSVRPEMRLAILVGLLGGFTTFSSFGFETFTLLNDGQWRLVTANILLSNVLGLLAAWGGYHAAEAWFGTVS